MKYIGETSRSGYERLNEHWKDFENLNEKSHILKHYLIAHQDIPIRDMRIRVKVLKRYRNAFERQIGESIYINENLKLGTNLLNSKNEYNRCSIPRLAILPSKDEMMEEIREEQEEKRIRKEISKLRQRLKETGEEPKRKKIKLIDVCNQMIKENYVEWTLRKIRERKKREEEEKRETEKIERLNRAKEKKRILLEKIERKKIISGPTRRDKIWIENRQQSWRKFREK